MTDINWKDARKLLIAPFAPAAMKFRIDGKPNKNGQCRTLTYIDSRLAMERLSDVDPTWSDEYKLLAGTPTDPFGLQQLAPTECRLTLLGVTRTGIGQISANRLDDKYAKSAYSDALKRAAVEFGIGAYLYSFPQLFVGQDHYWKMGDKIGGINDKGMQKLRADYGKVIGHADFVARFGKYVDYGDEIARSIPDIAAPEAEPVLPLSVEQVDALAMIAETASPGTVIRKQLEAIPAIKYDEAVQRGLKRVEEALKVDVSDLPISNPRELMDAVQLLKTTFDAQELAS